MADLGPDDDVQSPVTPPPPQRKLPPQIGRPSSAVSRQAFTPTSAGALSGRSSPAPSVSSLATPNQNLLGISPTSEPVLRIPESRQVSDTPSRNPQLQMRSATSPQTNGSLPHVRKVSSEQAVNSVDSASLLTPLSQSQSGLLGVNGATDETNSDREDRSPKPYQIPVLYKLACTDNMTSHRDVKIDRYSSEPFQGLKDPENRQTLSVMDVVDSISGMFMPDKVPRKNQRREDFGTSKLVDANPPFVVGQDFISRAYSITSARVMSTFAIDFIKAGVPYYPHEIRDQELWINEPYRLLAYNYDRLVDAVEGTDSGMAISTGSRDDMGRAHLKVLLDWYRPIYRKEIGPELSLYAHGKTTYQKLWLLYKPGTIVFTGKDEHMDCYIVHSLYHPFVKSEGGLVEQTWYWHLSLWCLDFDGTQLVRRSKAAEVQIPKFTGEKDISELHFAPLAFMKPEQGDKQTLIDRGKLHFQLVRQAPVLRQYSGALSGNKSLQYSGAVIVDPLTYTERRKENSTLGTVAPTVDVEDRRSNREPDD